MIPSLTIVPARDPSTLPPNSMCAPCSSPTCIWAPAPPRPSGCSTCCAAARQMSSTWWATSSISGACGPVWPQSHNDVLQKLMRKVRKGTRLILIPGNHDEGLRDYAGMQFGGVEIHRDHVHVTARGGRYVVMHGDEFDMVVRTAKWLALLGDRGYELALWLNNPLNWARRHLGLGYWSLSACLKNRVKKAMAFIGAFEEAVAAEARRRAADGIICGHIHHAADRLFEGVHYLNCGDWVESCTAIVESHAGDLQVIHWADQVPGLRKLAAASVQG